MSTCVGPPGIQEDSDAEVLLAVKYLDTSSHARVLKLYDVQQGSLAACGYLINRRLKAVICLDCKSVIEPHNLKTHNTRKHKFLPPIPADLIDALQASGTILPSFPPVPTTVVHAYQGLHAVSGFACPHCSSSYSAPKSLTNHMLDVHKETLPLKNASLHAAYVQRFTRGNENRSWFQVHLAESAPPCASIPYLQKKREELNARPSLDQLDVRQISPWHITTGWYQYLCQHQSLDLLAMIKIPSTFDGPFSVLPLVKQYFEHAYALIPSTSQLSRQILATENPQEWALLFFHLFSLIKIPFSDLCHTPFNRHQDPSTPSKYFHLLLQLVAFILRAAETPGFIILHPDILSIIQNDLAHFPPPSATAQDVAFPIIRRLFTALWTKQPPYNPDDEFSNPTIRFVIHTQVTPAGALRGPTHVTGVFAKLVYNMVSCFECHDISKSSPPSSDCSFLRLLILHM